MDSVKVGTVNDTYGRTVDVWADKSGAVRLDLGNFDIMLDRMQLRFLVTLANHALQEMTLRGFEQET